MLASALKYIAIIAIGGILIAAAVEVFTKGSLYTLYGTPPESEKGVKDCETLLAQLQDLADKGRVCPVLLGGGINNKKECKLLVTFCNLGCDTFPSIQQIPLVIKIDGKENKIFFSAYREDNPCRRVYPAVLRKTGHTCEDIRNDLTRESKRCACTPILRVMFMENYEQIRNFERKYPNKAICLCDLIRKYCLMGCYENDSPPLVITSDLGEYGVYKVALSKETCRWIARSLG